MSKRPSRHKQTSVVLAYISGGKIDAPFMDSVIGLMQYDATNHGYLDPGRCDRKRPLMLARLCRSTCDSRRSDLMPITGLSYLTVTGTFTYNL